MGKTRTLMNATVKKTRGQVGYFEESLYLFIFPVCRYPDLDRDAGPECHRSVHYVAIKLGMLLPCGVTYVYILGRNHLLVNFVHTVLL